MLRLAEHIGGYMGGVAFAVGNDQDFTGARNHVDGHQPENLLLGLRNIRVAGADDFVHLGDAFGTVGQGSDGLGAAHLEDLIHPRDLRRRQDGRVHFAVLSRRRGHHDLRAPGDPGGNGVHQHRGGVGRRAAGDVDAHLLDGGHLLAQDDARLVRDDKAVSHLLRMEQADVLRSLLQNGEKFRLHQGKGFFDLLLGYR